MSNPAKRTGTDFETDGVDYLNAKGLNAERNRQEPEKGDVHFGGDGQWTLEFKAETTIDLPGYLNQLAAELDRRGTPTWKGAAVIKNRRHSIGDAYAVMAFKHYRQLAVYVQALELLAEMMTGATLAELLAMMLLTDVDGLLSTEGDIRQRAVPADDGELAVVA